MTHHRKPNTYFYKKEDRSHSLVSALNEHLIDLRKSQLKEAFSNYEGAGHRLEYVKTINRVDFINDSRALTANAVWYAMQSMYKPITWIMNMTDIEEVTEDLLDVIQEKVKRIVIQGVYNSEVIDLFTGLGKEVAFAMNLEDAVRTSLYSSDQGDVVLFSPGTPSRGIFHSYQDRGEKFKEAIAQL